MKVFISFTETPNSRGEMFGYWRGRRHCAYVNIADLVEFADNSCSKQAKRYFWKRRKIK